MGETSGLAFIDLTLSVNSFTKKNKKIILNNISGSFQFGSINGLMGTSGSGKTSLLKCLYKNTEHILDHKSKIYYNSKEAINSCFISQDRNQQLLWGLTVKQCLTYASKLKNSDESQVNHKLIVENLMKDFLIADTKDNYLENCSGGQLKRLTIASELSALKKPKILLIDEPTSGLDSNAAEMVIDCLKNLSQNHKTLVLASIHQPNNQLFIKFDTIYVLAKGGVCLYSGIPQNLKPTLLECDIKCDENQVPIEVLLNISSNGINGKKVIELCDKNAIKYPALKENCGKQMTLTANGIKQNPKSFRLKDFWNLMLRTIRYSYLSQFKTLLVQIFVYTIFAICLAKSYNENIGKTDGCFSLSTISDLTCKEMADKKTLIEENLYLIYTSSLVFFIIQIAITTTLFIKDIKIFSAEHQNNWYSAGSFYLAKTLVEMIPSLLFSFIFAYLTFNLSGQLSEDFRFYKYLYIITFGVLCTQSVGSSVGIILHENLGLAMFTSIGILCVLSNFNNFMVPIAEMNSVEQTISRIAFPNFIYNSLLIVIYGFDRCKSPGMSYVLHQFNIKSDQIFWNNSKYLLFNYIIFKSIEFLILWIKANKFSLKSYINKTDDTIRSDIYHTNKGFIDINIDRKAIDLNEDVNGNIGFGTKQVMIAWIDLSFTINQKYLGKETKILDDLSGGIKIGSFNALMGPSGAGKTTLLKCLLDRRYANGLSPKTKIYENSRIKMKTCFVTQNSCEHLLKGLTVYQTLLYASQLKNSLETDKIDHKTNIRSLMNELLINDIEETKVENCSGGEQKRVVIASELTAKSRPNLLCVDEPTTGLDSNSAQLVINCLKSLTRRHGISVIASIHQPNTDIFLKFDSIYILAKGGVCVYSGSPLKLRQHLIDCDIECSETEFPIEVMLKVSSNDLMTTSIENMIKNNNKKKEKLIEKCEKQTKLLPNGIECQNKKFKITDAWILLKRLMAFVYVSQWKAVVLQFLITEGLAVAFTGLFKPEKAHSSGCLQINDNDNCFISLEDWQEELDISLTIKYNFSILCFVTFLQLVVTTLTFSSDVNIFINEHRNGISFFRRSNTELMQQIIQFIGWYSSGSYYWAKSTVDVIPIVITFLVYSWIINIYDSIYTYLGYLYLITLAVLCVQCLGHISGIIFNKNLKLSMLFSYILLLIQLILSNSLIPIHEFNYIIQYISDFAFLKHSFESIILMNYGFNRCESDEISMVLYRFDIENKNFWYNSGFLIIHLIVLKVLTLIALIIKTNVFRGRRKTDQIGDSYENKCFQITLDTDPDIKLSNFNRIIID